MMLSESLKAVVAQTLCKKVDGGRVAAREVLLANNAVSNLIREGKTFQLATWARWSHPRPALQPLPESSRPDPRR
jgi:Tfp pilus assembly pilus retraction ATPase PilT